MRILITGATGFIGTRLADVLHQGGHEVVRLGRSAPPEALEGSDALVVAPGGRAGGSAMDREKRKQRIRESRVLGTEQLMHGLSITRNRPKVLICASAVGYYGDRGDETLTEDASPGTGFLARVCCEWEAKADLAEALGMRVVKVRTGMVLGPNGGALKKMLLPFKAGVGGRLGNGRQWMPWIHLDDITGIFRHALEGSVAGVLNGAAPGVVTNAQFTAALGKALHRPAVLPVPRFALKLMFGEMADMVLGSQKVDSVGDGKERISISVSGVEVRRWSPLFVQLDSVRVDQHLDRPLVPGLSNATFIRLISRPSTCRAYSRAAGKRFPNMVISGYASTASARFASASPLAPPPESRKSMSSMLTCSIRCPGIPLITMPGPSAVARNPRMLMLRRIPASRLGSPNRKVFNRAPKRRKMGMWPASMVMSEISTFCMRAPSTESSLMPARRASSNWQSEIRILSKSPADSVPALIVEQLLRSRQLVMRDVAAGKTAGGLEANGVVSGIDVAFVHTHQLAGVDIDAIVIRAGVAVDVEPLGNHVMALRQMDCPDGRLAQTDVL